MTAPPLVWAIIGPNGAGKSTYYEFRIRPVLKAPFINADVIARERWPEDAVARSYDAAKLSASMRVELVESRRSFVMETVFSHPSELDLLLRAKAAGFEVRVSFIYLDHADLSVARVGERVSRGGHHVPIDKVRGRYERLVPLAAKAVRLADVAYVIDNSSRAAPLRDVLRFDRGDIVWLAKRVPRWTQQVFGSDLARL